MDAVKRLLLRFYAPVAGAPLLFALVMLCCAAAPAVSVLCGGRQLHFLLYALLQGAAWGWLACALAGRRGGLRAAVGGVFMLAAMTEVAHFALLRHCIDADSVRLVLNTDAGEARGFFRQFFGPLQWLALAAGIALIAAAVWALWRSRLRLPGRSAVVAALLLVAVCTGFAGVARMLTVFGARSYEQIVVWQSQGSDNPELCHGRRVAYTDPIVKAVCIARTLTLEQRNFRRWSHLQEQLYARRDLVAPHQSVPDSLRLVVVIGESFIRSHSSLYGYGLPVNPRLEQEARDSALTVFTDAVAPANFTVLSLSNVLCLNSVSHGENWWESPYFPLLFRRAGWDVELFTNQYSPDADADLGSMLFDPLMTDSVYSRYNSRTWRYDADFLAAMADSATPRSAHPTLTLWHLRGQHFPPSDRLPASSRHPFTAADIPADRPWLTEERRAVVADYANATLYNDSIVGSIIDMYRDSPAILFYFSDHGEEMWDSAPFGNRNRQQPDDADWMRRQHDVPLFVWMSPSLRRLRPELASALREAAGRPVALDRIGHTLLGVAGIGSPFRRPELDVLSPGYRPMPRVTAQGYRYPERP